MTVEEFRKSPKPDSFPPALQALWYDARGDWHKAHELAQAADDAIGDWVHAYLHRKEGDETNAFYWYARARKQKPSVGLDAEWDNIATSLLTQFGR